MFIQTRELEKILQDENLILIDSRSFKEYSEGHLPGAVNLDLFSFHWLDTTKQGIETFNTQTEKIFSFVGISSDKKAVFYDNVSGMLAARGVWLLRYLSHPESFMLDGGFSKWKSDGLPIESKQNGFKPAHFSGKPDPNLIIGFEYILQNNTRLHIIDARSPDEYNGIVVRAAQKGHIPNSINIDWNHNISEDGTLKNDRELSKIYQLPKDAEIITYCQGAYRAANSFLVLKKLGYENVKVYLGSWGEWGNKTELPVE